MRQRLLDLVDQDQAEIAGLQAGERRVNGDEFAVDGVDLPGAPGIAQTVAEQGDDFAVLAPALAGILVENHLVEGFAKDLGLLADIVVAAVAGAADDH